MNVWRITLFVFMLQSGIMLVGLANLPIKCNAAGTSCVPFNIDTMSSVTMIQIIDDEIDTSQYKSTQIETDIFADVYTATSTGLKTAVNILYGAALGIYAFTVFVFGNNAVGVGIGAVLQAIVWVFYLRSAVSIIKEGKGEI